MAGNMDNKDSIRRIRLHSLHNRHIPETVHSRGPRLQDLPGTVLQSRSRIRSPRRHRGDIAVLTYLRPPFPLSYAHAAG